MLVLFLFIQRCYRPQRPSGFYFPIVTFRMIISIPTQNFSSSLAVFCPLVLHSLSHIFILVSKTAQAAKPKYRRLSCLNHRHVFLPVLEAGKSKIKVLAHSTAGENPLPDLQAATHSLYPHTAEQGECTRVLVS